jgi:hypothetical protein
MNEFLGDFPNFSANFAAFLRVLRGQGLFGQGQEQKTLTAKNAEKIREGRGENRWRGMSHAGGNFWRKLQTIYK